MSAWHAAASLDRETLTSGLAAQGIHTDDDASYHGTIDVADLGLSVDIVISVPENFPYGCPTVKPIDGTGGFSWHRERMGNLCLYTDDDAAVLPWKNPEAFLERIREWYRRDAAGWPGDPADLDLERYWPRRAGLVIYDRDDLVPSAVLRVIRDKHHIRLETVKGTGKKHAGKVLVVDAGQLDEPLHSWSDLADVIIESDSVERRIRAGSVKFLAVLYQRAPHDGVLVLEVTGKHPPDLAALESADRSTATLRLRSGPEADAVGDLNIALVGAGAVGCRLADLLIRMGPRVLTVVDGDTLRPGNLVRHSAFGDLVGANKAEAVIETARRCLGHTPWSPTELRPVAAHLTSIEEATALLVDHDLVLDATANGVATALLMTGAQIIQRPVVSVCLQRDGQLARVDRAPLKTDESHQAPIEPLPDEGVVLRESGCGDPVSPTPPWACSAAASLALAVAADAIIGSGHYGATTIQVLVPQADQPYDTVGVIT